MGRLVLLRRPLGLSADESSERWRCGLKLLFPRSKSSLSLTVQPGLH